MDNLWICNLWIWLVVCLPLWKIWKSIGMITPNIWKNKTCSKPPTRRCMFHIVFCEIDQLDLPSGNQRWKEIKENHGNATTPRIDRWFSGNCPWTSPFRSRISPLATFDHTFPGRMTSHRETPWKLGKPWWMKGTYSTCLWDYRVFQTLGMMGLLINFHNDFKGHKTKAQCFASRKQPIPLAPIFGHCDLSINVHFRNLNSYTFQQSMKPCSDSIPNLPGKLLGILPKSHFWHLKTSKLTVYGVFLRAAHNHQAIRLR